MLEAHFLPPLQLYYAAVVNHQLDRPIADRLERLPQLPKKRRREEG
jgi:hypothetical protein